MALRKIVLKFTTNPAGEPVNRFTENCCLARPYPGCRYGQLVIFFYRVSCSSNKHKRINKGDVVDKRYKQAYKREMRKKDRVGMDRC
jgi:hypothetical protein